MTAARRVLVTGARGNVGREVVRACAAAGFDVHAPKLDFLDRATWPAALDGAAYLFLMRPPPIGDMRATLIPFVDEALARGVEHMVFLSVAGADRMKWVPHRKVELHLAAGNASWTVLRPGFFAQNLGDAYRRDIVEDDRLYVPAKDGRVAFVDVRDAGDITARIFGNPRDFRGAALTLTGPEALPFAEVAALLTATLGRPIRYVPATIPGYALHLRRRRRMSWTQIVVQTVLHVGLRRGDAERVDPTVERILGRPARTLAGYIADHAALWSRERA